MFLKSYENMYIIAFIERTVCAVYTGQMCLCVTNS